MSRYFNMFYTDRVSSSRGAICKVERSAQPGNLLLPLSGPWRSEVEQLVERLYLNPDSPAPRVLTFIGVERTADSCAVHAHASDVLSSRVAGSVCAVESNPNGPSIEGVLGLSQRRGLSDLLQDGDLELNNALLQVPGSNLWLLPSGGATDGSSSQTSLSNPPRYYDRMRDLLSQMRTSFAFVTINAPPINTGSDAMSLGRLSDGVVLVLRASRTRWESARRLKQDLKNVGAMVLGAILTDFV